jgi:hypothetical protein
MMSEPTLIEECADAGAPSFAGAAVVCFAAMPLGASWFARGSTSMVIGATLGFALFALSLRAGRWRLARAMRSSERALMARRPAGRRRREIEGDR